MVEGQTFKERLLIAVQDSYQAYVDHGARSNQKIKVLHGWIISELTNVLGKEYVIKGLSESGGKEQKVRGKYYEKNVDVAISREGIILGVVSVKFVMSNYNQNKHNYFEQQLGETANLRSKNIVYGHIMLRTQPTPYLGRDPKTGKQVVKKNEYVKDTTVQLYSALATDHGADHIPDVQCLAIFQLGGHKGKILRLCNQSDLPEVSAESYELLRTILGINSFFQKIRAAIHSKYVMINHSDDTK